MVDFVYAEKLEDDLLTQFRGQKNNTAIMRSYARQLQEVYAFLKSLLSLLDLDACTGPQLDLIGEIVVLSRYDARVIVGDAYEGQILDDDLYRKIIKYKILKNTSDCTYWSIMKGIKMFWDKPLYYREDPEQPAVMILETRVLAPEDHAEDLFSVPIIKAGGVGIHLRATTEAPPFEPDLHITPVLGRGMAITELPELEPEMPDLSLRVTPVLGRGMAVTKLPVLEPVFEEANTVAYIGAAAPGSIMETRLPPLPEFDTEIPAAVDGRVFVALHGNIIETRLPELKEEIV